MTAAEALVRLQGWADREICQKIKLKKPNDKANDQDYPYALVNPGCFILFLPNSERETESIPSLTVQLLEGKDDPIGRKGQMTVRFGLATWSPGLHGGDLYLPIPGSKDFSKLSPEEAQSYYRRDQEGWQDVMNFIDVCRRALETSVDMDGVTLVTSEVVTYGLYGDDSGALINFYPYWYAWLQFAVEYPVFYTKPGDDFL